jgi:hypothetical protein
MMQNLDDITAQRILGMIVRTGNMPPEVSWDMNLKQCLAETFQIAPASAPVSDGDLARHALLVLAEDPEMRSAIEIMAANAEATPKRFDFGTTIGITAAVLMVLQTHIRFERSSTGKWNLKIEKKPTSDALLKELVQKFINFKK